MSDREANVVHLQTPELQKENAQVERLGVLVLIQG